MVKDENYRLNRFLKVYPWESGLTGDLLFYIAIDTLFLTIVKNLSAAQIVSIYSLSQLFCILLQFPTLFIIKKIGNTASIRTGSFLLLMSAVLITVGKSYYIILLGRMLHDLAAMFKSTSVVALENTLDMLDRKSEFVKYRTSANTVYAVVTMIISFVASCMFNLNYYLPMVGCITTCTIGFILSLFMKDYSGFNKISRKKQTVTSEKVRYGRIIIVVIVLFSLFYFVVQSGQSEGKLFIQQNLLQKFDVEKTSLIIGAIVCISRIVRVASNVVFEKLYKKYANKMGIALCLLLSTSICCLLFGSFIPQIILKIVVMTLGYTIILFARDPFRLYIQDVLFANTPREQHQTLLVMLSFGEKIAKAGIGLIFSAILLSHPITVIMWILLAIMAFEIVLSLVVYRSISKNKSWIN